MEFDEKLGFDGEVKRVNDENNADENFPTAPVKELIPAFRLGWSKHFQFS